MPKVNPYLNFPGTCEEAFNYYKEVFGGEFSFVGRFKDMPPQEGVALSEEDLNQIMHISLPIGTDHMIMGSDSPGEWATQLIVGNNMSVSVSADSKSYADDVFNGLAADGNIKMPIGPTFWGDYFGMCTDKYGINWMVSFNEAT